MVEKAIGGHDVCHTCAAHCVVIEDLEARIRELEAALREAIEGHKVWESVYGSSATSRAHLSFLETALGTSQETKVYPPSFNGWIQGPCENCGKSSRDHIGLSMACPTEKIKGYAP